MPNNGYFDIVFASAGDVTPVPDPAQGSGNVSYTQGYTPPYSLAPTNPSAILVQRGMFNQILKDITGAIQFLQQNGASNFITTAMNNGTPYSYKLGAVVMYDAGSGLEAWVSTAPGNVTIPGAIGATWSPLTSPASAIFIGGTSTGSANAQAVATNVGNFTNAAGNIVTMKAGFSVTAASTLTVDSAAALTIKVMGQSGLRDTATGDIVVGGEYQFIDNGTYLQLLNSSNYLQANLNLSDLANLNTSLTNLTFASSIGTSGYIKLPNAADHTKPFIFQWGKDTSGGASVSITFPVTFPTAVLGFIVTSAPSSPMGGVLVSPAPTTSGFSLDTETQNPCWWAAWGN